MGRSDEPQGNSQWRTANILGETITADVAVFTKLKKLVLFNMGLDGGMVVPVPSGSFCPDNHPISGRLPSQGAWPPCHFDCPRRVGQQSNRFVLSGSVFATEVDVVLAQALCPRCFQPRSRLSICRVATLSMASLPTSSLVEFRLERSDEPQETQTGELRTRR